MTFKKTLAVTTALSAVALLSAHAAVAAEAPKLKFGGYQEVYFGAGDVTAGTSNSGTPTYKGSKIEDGQFGIVTYGELKFEAKGKTDSGMKWGAKYELALDDAQSDGKAGADEAGIYMSGSWGRLEIGNNDGAADKMQIDGGLEFNTIGSNVIGAFFETRGSNSLRGEDGINVGENSDETKLVYYTPRVSGFQAGISWGPNASAKGTNADIDGNGKGQGFWEAGVSYKGKAGGMKYEVAGVATHQYDADDDFGGDGWGIGATVHNGPFGFAAGYSKNEDWRKNGSEQTAWSVGANYSAGAMTAALVYVDSELDVDSSTNKDEFNSLSLQIGYNLGGGLTTAVGIYDLQVKSNGSNVNEATGVIAKIGANF
jgi:hypothetical protein